MTFPSRRLTGPDTLRRHFNMVNQSKGTIKLFPLAMLIGKLLGEHSTGIGRLERQRHVLWPGLGQTSLTAPALSKIKCGQPIYVYEKHRATYAFFWCCDFAIFGREPTCIWEKGSYNLPNRATLAVAHWRRWWKMCGCEHVFGLATVCVLYIKSVIVFAGWTSPSPPSFSNGKVPVPDWRKVTCHRAGRCCECQFCSEFES